MKHWLRFTCGLAFALAAFAAGVLVGRTGLDPNVALAQPTSPVPEHSLLQAKGASGGALSWEQLGSSLQLTVTGSDAAFLGVAALSDIWAWPELDSAAAEILHGGTAFELDLTAVDQLTFYRLEPIATLRDGVFIPCEEIVVGDCFPIRIPDPPPDSRVVTAGWR